MTEVHLEQSITSTPIPLWREVVAFYSAHLSAVIRVLLPPTAMAYLAALGFQYQIDLLRASMAPASSFFLMSRGLLAYEKVLVPMQLLFLLKQWFLWICYCFALIGICNLVSDVNDEGRPSATSVFSTIRERPLRFLSSSTLFFGLLIVAYTAMTFIMFGIVNIEIRAHIPSSPIWNLVVTFGAIALVSAVIVRWAFTVPLAVLDDLSFPAAMKQSDRLTNYRMLPLWELVIESEVTGYLAVIAPSYVLFYLHVPSTQFTYYSAEAAAILLSALTQAPLMIGIALVLARNAGESEAGQPSSAAAL